MMSNIVIRPAQESDTVGMALVVARGQAPRLAEMPQLKITLPAGAVAYCGAIETHPQGREWIQALASWWQEKLTCPQWRIIVLSRGHAIAGVAALNTRHHRENDGSRSARSQEVSYLELDPELQNLAMYQRVLRFLLPDYQAGQIWVPQHAKILEKACEKLGFFYDGTKKLKPEKCRRLVR